MDGTAVASSRDRPAGDPASIQRQLAFAAWTTLFVSFIFISLVLIARRLSGAFVQAPNGLFLVVAATAINAIAAGIRWLLLTECLNRFSGPPLNDQGLRSLIRVAPFVLPGLAAAGVLLALTLPGVSLLAAVFAWLLL